MGTKPSNLVKMFHYKMLNVKVLNEMPFVELLYN